jgi:phenylacetate-coenzyme A ligase PaaK-like adenylate-forming protein
MSAHQDRLPTAVVRAALRASLYHAVGETSSDRACLAAWPLHDYSVLLATADPFGGRRDPAAAPDVIVQASKDLTLYWALTGHELEAMAAALARCWLALGAQRDDRIAIYDYGTSPLALYASRYYAPHLSAGAAELTGCVPICNDGLPEFAARAVHVITYVRPRMLFVDGEVADPLVAAYERARSLQTVPDTEIVVSADEEPVSQDRMDAWAARLGVRVTQVLRADLALFMCPPCVSTPSAYHPHRGDYTVEIVDEAGGSILEAGQPGLLAVTNLNLHSCPVVRYVTNIRAVVTVGPCQCGSDSVTVETV